MRISNHRITRSQRNAANSASDFTLQDFANATPSRQTTARLKKSSARDIFQGVVMEGNKESGDLAWYEKDLSDFDLSDAEENQEEESVTTRTHRRKAKQARDESRDTGVVYSVDVWFLIGDHVAPEDVQGFAAICRGTHIVSHSARFWLSMYHRLCKNKKESTLSALPYALSPSCTNNMHGFRSRVIRAMFLLYEPFKQRFNSRQSFGSLHPEILRGYRCTLMWHKEDKNLWHFYFKFYNPHRKHCALIGSGVKLDKLDLLDDDNIHYNSEEGSYVLQVVSQNFNPIPPMVMGETLTKASINVGMTMSYNKLRLEFGLAAQCSVLIDPVVNVHVFPWWHPAYPHQSNK